MATIPRRPATRAHSGRFRWTSEQYYEVAKLGFFDDRKVELVEGELYTMTVNPPHAICLELLTRALIYGFGPDFRVRIQLPIDLGRHNQPEPDAAVLPFEGKYELVHPTIASLLVEVSDSTLRKDRGVKAHVYARAGIADYWIINLAERQVEVCRRPGPDPSRRGRFGYAEVTVVRGAGRMAPLARPGLELVADDLLPPAPPPAQAPHGAP